MMLQRQRQLPHVFETSLNFHVCISLRVWFLFIRIINIYFLRVEYSNKCKRESVQEIMETAINISMYVHSKVLVYGRHCYQE